MFSIFHRRVALSLDILRGTHSAECARLHAIAFAHPWSVQEFEALIANESSDGTAALDVGGCRLHGFILVRQAADEAEILTIAVDKAVRKQGIGKALLERQLDRLQLARVRKLFLEVDEDNKAALQLYRGSGFSQVGNRPGYYRTGAGKPANALILARDLA